MRFSYVEWHNCKKKLPRYTFIIDENLSYIISGTNLQS